MKKIIMIVAATTVVGIASPGTAMAKSHHYRHHYGWMHGFRGSNAELRGNNGNSASGSNSLANPNNAAGAGSGAAGWKFR